MTDLAQRADSVKIGESGEACWWSVCYQQVLPRLVFPDNLCVVSESWGKLVMSCIFRGD